MPELKPDLPTRKRNQFLVLVISGITALVLAFTAPSTIEDVFFPGSQDGESGTLESPDRCASCHGGYDRSTEPIFNWKGSMMAQAARDPLYEACLAITNQDVPDGGDLCIRCHSPEGWLAGRSVPTDGSALTISDMEGIHCDFCHRMVEPSPIGANPHPLDPTYTDLTYPADQIYLLSIDSLPPMPGNGMYIIDSDDTKRGPFSDPGAKHAFYYSPFHAESAICGTCHDVSNPVYDRQPDGSYKPNAFGMSAPSYNTYDLFPVERTYSEWLVSEYNTETGVHAPQFGGNKTYVSTCQDCHMRDISGVAANKNSAVFRHDLPFHDMTGGNTVVPEMIKTLFPNDVDHIALDSAASRARQMLKKAASIELTVDNNGDHFLANVRVTNETGHKLPSGYPEGRRIWIHVVARDAGGTVVYESGHYDLTTGVLTHDADAKIYEIKPGLDGYMSGVTGLPDGPSFHFVLNNKIFSDNRIPPRGFTNAAFEAIQSPSVSYNYADGQYWDDTGYILPASSDSIEVRLYYQTLSKEYVEFLRDENVTNDAGDVLYSLWDTHGKSSPVEMNFIAAKTIQDSDGDGVPDDSDNCPENPNPNQIDTDSDDFGAPCDCDDGDPAVTLGPTWYADSDADGYGDASSTLVACTMPEGYVDNADDCDDGDPAVTLGPTWYADLDADGYGDAALTLVACMKPEGYVDNADDCDDGDPAVTLGPTWYADSDADGYGDAALTLVACMKPEGYVDNADDCDDGDPAVTLGPTWYADSDADGYGDAALTLVACTKPEGYVDNADDCDDGDPAVNIERIWYADADRDGYGDSQKTTVSCQLPPDNTDNGDDCDDTDPDRYPGGPALPDGKDNDCDGVIDKVIQFIDFPMVGEVLEDTGTILLEAEASSGLVVTYEVVTGNVIVTGNMLSVNGPGEVTIKASQEGNQGYHPADPISQVFCVNPMKPVIRLFENNAGDPFLVSNALSGNRWYFEGTLLSEIMNDTMVPGQTGSYSNRIEVDQCTGEMSDPFYVELTGKDYHPASTILVYPNPTDGWVVFDLPDALHHSNLSISILDISGRYIHRLTDIESVMGIWKIDLAGLDPGLYHYVVVDQDRGRQYRGQVIVR